MNQLDRIEAQLIELRQMLLTWNAYKDRQLRVAQVTCGDLLLPIERVIPTDLGVIVEVRHG